MATIAENLQTIINIKADIKTAIENKGVDMSNTPFTEYSTKIDEISSGGESGSSLVSPYFSPEELLVIEANCGYDPIHNINYDVKEVNNFMITYKYDGIVAKSPNTGEPLIENYFFDSDRWEWRYITDANGNNYLTPTNSVIESMLYNDDYRITYNGSIIQEQMGKLCQNSSGEIYLNDIYGNSLPSIYIDNTNTYELDSWDITDPVNGSIIREFYPMVVHSQAVGEDMYIEDFYNTFKGTKNFDSIYTYGGHSDSLSIEENQKPIFCNHWFKSETYDSFSSYNNEYPMFIAPVMEFGNMYIYNNLNLSHPLIKKVTIGDIFDGRISFRGNKQLEEVNIKSVRNFEYLFEECSNLKKINNINMSDVTYVGMWDLSNCVSLTDVGGFQDLGRNFGYNTCTLGLDQCPNLSKQSIINIFKSVYDRTNTSTTKIRITYNMNNLLSEEDIAIVTNKSWIVEIV